MPSTVVHVGFAGLVGVALLGRHFDTRAILVVMAVAALPDLDTLIGLVVPGVHRAALHNVFVVLLPLALLAWDVGFREASFVRRRWGAYGHRVAWVSLFALFFAHVLLDAFFNGSNLLWPLHDRFYDLSGYLLVSSHDGIVQTFLELERASDGSLSLADSTARGTTADTHYFTGFDPTRGEEPADVERIFPIAETGELFVLTVTGYLVVLARVVEERRSG